MHKHFGQHHTHPSHKSLLVLVDGDDIQFVGHRFEGQVFVVDKASLDKLTTPEDRQRYVIMGANVDRVTHAEFETVLDGLLDPAPATAPPVDNDHIASGATPFTPEEIAANAPSAPVAAPALTPTDPPSGSATPTPTLSPDPSPSPTTTADHAPAAPASA